MLAGVRDDLSDRGVAVSLEACTARVQTPGWRGGSGSVGPGFLPEVQQ